MASQQCIKWFKTIVLMLVVFNTGWNLGVVSPTLPDIQYYTQSSTAALSTLFIWVGLACLLGALALSPLFDRYDWPVLMTLTLLTEAIFMGLAPFCPNLVGISVMIAIAEGVNFGNLTGGIAHVVRLWLRDDRLASMVQAADLMHIMGTAVIPQIIASFLGDYRAAVDSTPEYNITTGLRGTGMIQNDTMVIFGDLKYPYLIVSIFNLACALTCLVSFFLLRHFNAKYEEIEKNEKGEEIKNSNSTEKSQSETSLKYTTSVFMASVFVTFVCNGGRDILMGGLLYTYVTSFLSWSVDEGTLLLTLYHVIRTVLHILTVLLARCVRPMVLFAIDLVCLLVAPIIMIFTVEASKASVWILVSVIAIGTSNINATTLTVAQETKESKGKDVGIYLSGLALGLAAFSPISGVLLQVNGIVSFPAVLAAITAFSILLLVPWKITAKTLQQAKERENLVRFRAESVLNSDGEIPLNEDSPLLHDKDT